MQSRKEAEEDDGGGGGDRRGEIEIPDEDYDKFKNLFLSPTQCSGGGGGGERRRRRVVLGQGQIDIMQKGKGKERKNAGGTREGTATLTASATAGNGQGMELSSVHACRRSMRPTPHSNEDRLGSGCPTMHPSSISLAPSGLIWPRTMRIIVIAPISATNGAKQTTVPALALIKTLKELQSLSTLSSSGPGAA